MKRYQEPFCEEKNGGIENYLLDSMSWDISDILINFIDA